MLQSGQRYVCDLKLVAKTRLLCGLYSRFAVAPRWRPIARMYCIAVALAFSSYSYFFLSLRLPGLAVYVWVTNFFEYLLGNLISQWTGDEYLHKYFTQNQITDITLDSHVVFNRLQKQIKKAYVFAFLPYAAAIFVANTTQHIRLGFVGWLILVVPSLLLDVAGISVSTTKMLIIALFDARLLVLKRNLKRYGFRTVGRRKPQAYCQTYDQILQDLNATNRPLKIMLLIELISSCVKIILSLLTGLYYIQMQEVLNVLLHVIMATKNLICSFGHVRLLESAAASCDEMADFAATELIKTPTEDERRRILGFIDVVQNRGARYNVLRALPLDARLLLAVFGFCSAQFVVFAKTVKPE